MVTLAGCTNKEEIEQLKQQNELLQQQIDQQNQEDQGQLSQEETKQNETYRKECMILQEEKQQENLDFINKCTGQGGNSIDFCINSPAGKFLAESLEDFLPKCIENKKLLKY
ncbi:MAG: hypothetical protein CO170_02155 [candidate division SR1 bacterium CG_4_9_14_3_um_filter_40_9]|nr:MAG: hypothetical protein CO170_02155 [candidate division SR1 bacterium CG_4_9_14_3_um_filter_40_9]